MKHVVFKSLPKTTVISFTVAHAEPGVAGRIVFFYWDAVRLGPSAAMDRSARTESASDVFFF